MKYKVATTVDEVIDAWCVVYRQYLAASLISPNEMSLFTFPEYISNNTAVILGRKMNKTVCTVSAVIDSPLGIPLDSYYHDELDQLRNEGRKLIEIGLLADARGTSKMSSITELMASIARFGVYSDHHDYVIGVHPRRINFFSSVFGFEPFGDVKGYGKLKTAPVVLLHAHGLDLEVASREINTEIYSDPRNLDFDERFQFNPGNFISDREFNASVEHFVQTLWKNKTLQPA